jgi:hypothetical protein
MEAKPARRKSSDVSEKMTSAYKSWRILQTIQTIITLDSEFEAEIFFLSAFTTLYLGPVQ